MTVRLLSVLLVAVAAMGICVAVPAVAAHHGAVSVADPERCC
jgi:hypothetical protein